MKFAQIPIALRLALGQLNDPRFIGVLLRALLLMLLITGPFFLVFVAIAGLLQWIFPAHITLPWMGQVGFIGLFTQGLVSKTSWVFWTYVMAPLALVIASYMLDPIVDAVEARHYPGLPAPHRMKPGQTLVYALRFLGLTATISIVALIASLFSSTLGPVIFVLANGYLMAREYVETVALRRMPPTQARALSAHHLPLVWAMGCVLALLLNVPVLNLLVPILGVAAFTHLYHRALMAGPSDETSPDRAR